jgi:hypothetical protein
MATPVPTRIRLRSDTSEQWYTADPILAPGEVGVETDTNRLKVGNGYQHWNELLYSYTPLYDPYSVHITYDPVTVVNETNNRLTVNLISNNNTTLNATLYVFINGTNAPVARYEITLNSGTTSDYRIQLPSLIANTDYRIDIVDNTKVIGTTVISYVKEYDLEISFSYSGTRTVRYTIKNNSTSLIRFTAPTVKMIPVRVLDAVGTLIPLPAGSTALPTDGISRTITGMVTINQYNALVPSTIYSNTYDYGTIFVNGIHYLIEFTFDSSFIYKTSSNPIQYSTQLISGASFNPDNNNNIRYTITDGVAKFAEVEISRVRNSIETVVKTDATRGVPGTYSITLPAGNLPINNDIYKITPIYESDERRDPLVLEFRQLIDISKVLITSRNSFVTNITDIDGSGYKLDVDILDPNTNNVLYDGIPVPITDLTNTFVQLNAGETNTYSNAIDIEKRLPSSFPASRVNKAFYGICLNPYNGNSKFYTYNNIKDALTESLKFSYRIRLFGSQRDWLPYDAVFRPPTQTNYNTIFGMNFQTLFDPDIDPDRVITNNAAPVGYRNYSDYVGGQYRSCILLHRILQVIKEEGGEYAKIQIYLGIGLSEVSEPTVSDWLTDITQLGDYFRAPRDGTDLGLISEYRKLTDLFYVIEKFGTDNICGIALGNEVIHTYVKESGRYGDPAQRFLLNRFQLMFEYIRKRFVYYYSMRDPANRPNPYSTEINTRLDGKTSSSIDGSWTSLGHARYTNTPIKYVPIGINETPNVYTYSVQENFRLSYLEQIMKLCDFTAINNHPYYNSSQYPEDDSEDAKDTYIQSQYSAFKRVFESCSTFIKEKTSPDMRIFVAEVGFPGIPEYEKHIDSYGTATGRDPYSFYPSIEQQTLPETNPLPDVRVGLYALNNVGVLRRLKLSIYSTADLQRRWASKLASSAISDGIDFYYFALTDNYLQATYKGDATRKAIVFKGNYVIMWGLYTYNFSYYDIVRKLQARTPPRTYITASSTDEYNLTLSQKHENTFLTSLVKTDIFKTISGVTETVENRDFKYYATEYPDIYYRSLPDFSFVYGTGYKFRYKAGGQTNNIIPAQPDPFYTVTFNSEFEVISVKYKSNRSIDIRYIFRSTGDLINTIWYIQDSADESILYTFPGLTLQRSAVDISSDGNTVSTTARPNTMNLTLNAPSIFTVGNSYKIIINSSPTRVLYQSPDAYEFSPLDITELDSNTIVLNIDFLSDYDTVDDANIYYLNSSSIETKLGTQADSLFTKPSTVEQEVQAYSIDISGANVKDYYATPIYFKGTFKATGKPNITIKSTNFPIEYDADTRITELYIKYDKSKTPLTFESVRGLDVTEPTGVVFYLKKKTGASSYTRIASINTSTSLLTYISPFNASTITFGSLYNIDWTVTPPSGVYADIVQTITANPLSDFLFYDYNSNITSRNLTINSIVDYSFSWVFINTSKKLKIIFDLYEADTNVADGSKLTSSSISILTSDTSPYSGRFGSNTFKIGKYYYIKLQQEIRVGDLTTVVETSPYDYIGYPTFTLDISFNDFGTGIVDGKFYYKINNYSGTIASTGIKLRLYNVGTDRFIDSDSFNSSDISDGEIIQLSTFSSFLQAGETYRAFLYFNGDATNFRGLSAQRTYTPMYISDIDSIGLTNTGIKIEGITWINRPSPPSTIPKISIIIKEADDIDNSAISPVYSVTNVNPSDSIVINTGLTRTIQYIVQLSVPALTEEPFRVPFTYNRIQFSSVSREFEDISSTLTGVGNLTITYTTNPITSFNSNTISFTLYEYDDLTGGTGLAITPIKSDQIFGTARTVRFNSEYLTYGKFYNVYYELSNDTDMNGFIVSTRLEYLPRGFDIILLIGADNMVGRDRDVTFTAGVYTINNERGGYPHLTNDEINVPLIDNNKNIVKIYNFNHTETGYTTNLTTNENIPVLHRISGNMKPYRLDEAFGGITLPTGDDGISCGYQFVKYYTDLMNVPENRRLCVVNAAVPLTKFEEPGSGSRSNVWIANKGLSTKVKDALNDISSLRTLGAIEYATDRIRYKNRTNTLKYGCDLSPSNMVFSQQIVDNFDYGYLVDLIDFASVHPRNDGDILLDNPGAGYTETAFRNMLRNELSYLKTGTLRNGHTAFNYTYRAQECKNDYTLDTTISKYANFLRDNEMKLRINGLLNFRDNTLRENDNFWLNESNSKINAICGLMRHVYHVINWFETNYPELVIGYDIIRDYSSVINVQVDGRDETPLKLPVTGNCMRFANKVNYTPSGYSTRQILNKTDRLFIEAIYIAAFAACKNRYDELEIGWSDEDFTYYEKRSKANAKDVVLHVVNTISDINDNYDTDPFPINTLSFQAKFSARNFLINPSNVWSGDDNEFTEETNILFNSSIQNGGLRNSIAYANTQRLKVSITEFQVRLTGGLIPGGGGERLLDTQDYWGSNYSGFRSFQYQYFLEKMHSLLTSSSAPSNLNKRYLGFGSLISRMPASNTDIDDSYQLESFFFAVRNSIDPTIAIETSTLTNFLVNKVRAPSADPYTSHRVVAVLWAGGGRNYDEVDSNYVPRLIGLFNDIYSSCLHCMKRSTAFLVSNFEQGFISKRASSDRNYDYETLKAIDRIDTALNPRSLRIQPISTIGLHSIDPDAPNNASLERNGWLHAGCFSARSQRLLGLRMFNGFLGKLAITGKPTSSIEGRSDDNNVIVPTDYRYNTFAASLENVTISSSSYRYSFNPIAYLVSSTYRILSSGSIVDKSGSTYYGLITEYNSDDKATSSSAAASKSMICYFSTPPETRTNSSVNGYPGTISTTYNINNILRADYSYDTTYSDITTSNKNVIKDKYLFVNISEYLKNIATNIPSTSDYKGINLKASAINRILNSNSQVNTITNGSSPRYLPPISMFDWRNALDSWNDVATGSSSMYRAVNTTNFPLFTNNNLTHISVNTPTKTATIVGYDPNQSATTLPSGASSIRILNDGSDRILLIGQFLSGDYSSQFNSKIDSIQFFTEGTSTTIRNVGGGSDTYASLKRYNQAAGMSVGTNPGNQDPGGELVRAYPFFFIRNSQTYIKINLHNIVASKQYTIRYQFAVRSNRVPYSGSFDVSKNVNINSNTYNFLLSQEFPITIRSVTGAVIATQDINFTLSVPSRTNSNTSHPSTIYVHKDGEWNGHWKDIRFDFRISSMANAAQMYLQIGPLTSHIETTFYFRNFVLGIEN